jgi:hypothetical protein
MQDVTNPISLLYFYFIYCLLLTLGRMAKGTYTIETSPTWTGSQQAYVLVI